jgi:hypothetical protein
VLAHATRANAINALAIRLRIVRREEWIVCREQWIVRREDGNRFEEHIVDGRGAIHASGSV